MKYYFFVIALMDQAVHMHLICLANQRGVLFLFPFDREEAWGSVKLRNLNSNPSRCELCGMQL